MEPTGPKSDHEIDRDRSEIHALRTHYRSGINDLAKEFFRPCLARCTLYRRAAGYFSSTALKTWAEALPRLIGSRDMLIQLLISPILSAEDKTALQRAMDETERDRLRQVIVDELIIQALNFAYEPEDRQLRLQLFTWLVANERLTLRFAFPTHVEDAGMYHEKIGVFDFAWGDQVAFVGSANETTSGHAKNYELVHVYRSWADADAERVQATVADFEVAWQGSAPGLRVIQLSTEALSHIKTRSPSKRPEVSDSDESKTSAVHENGGVPSPWRHQEEAVAKFLAQRHGILEMATGTGKTRTALKILEALEKQQLIDGAIVTTEGTDLLDQWHKELLSWGMREGRSYRMLRHYGVHHQSRSFSLNPLGAILIVSRQQLPQLFKALPPARRRRLIVVHDEVHGLGSPESLRQLSDQHRNFDFTLGLSATPEREYDQEGTEFITREIGPIIYRFDLKDAIERGILCEFDYVPLPYELTESDKQRLQQVFSKAEGKRKQGIPVTEKEIWIDLSRVYKTAEQKPAAFQAYLPSHPGVIKHAIFFVETKEYGEQLLPILHAYTHLYRTYYAEDDRNNLVEFSKGGIDCLVTCHRLSQGIDIRHLRSVVLFSAARAKLETIQRIGRCLRVDPDHPEKRALVIDFVRESTDDEAFPNADSERCAWLTELSHTRRKEGVWP